MTNEQLAKLPKWAQDHIKSLQYERDAAVKTLNEFCDRQTVTPICVTDNPCTGEQRGPVQKTNFIQGYEVQFKHAGVDLSVNILHEDRIEIRWCSTKGHSLDECTMIPYSYQMVRLKAGKGAA